MVMVTIGRRSVVPRLVAGVCAVGLLFGATGCQNSDDEPLIHANHDQGAVLGGRLDHLKSTQEYRDMSARLEKWGAEQSPDWLSICNTINRKALRDIGFDPQNDLQNRDGGRLQFVCVWKQSTPHRIVSIGRVGESLDYLRNRKSFNYRESFKQGDSRVDIGTMNHDLIGAKSCTANMTRKGKNYTIAYMVYDLDVQDDELCRVVTDLAEIA